MLAVEALRVVMAEVDVEVGSVLARRGFSASALLTDVLLVVAVRGDAEVRTRRLLLEASFVTLIGVMWLLSLPRLRFASSSSCAAGDG